jgi:hypothetical protein
MAHFIQFNFAIQIWSSWHHLMEAAELAMDSIINSSKSTSYNTNMKRTKETGMCRADDNQKKKDNVATIGDISNQNDEGLKSKEDPLKINQSSPASQKTTSLSFPTDTKSSTTTNLFAKNNITCNTTSMPATSINSR